MATNVGAKKRAGIVLVIIGIVILILALMPVVTGNAGGAFGSARAGAIVAGAVTALVGFVLSGKKGHKVDPPA